MEFEKEHQDNSNTHNLEQFPSLEEIAQSNMEPLDINTKTGKNISVGEAHIYKEKWSYLAKNNPKQRTKRPSPQIWKFYSIEGDSFKRLRTMCPRCGTGVYLANHKDRRSCGKCGYAEFIKE